MALTCILFFVLAFTQLRAADDKLPHVSVFGTATVKAQPDLRRWHITVTNKGDDVAAVSDTHTVRAAAVLRLLKDKGILPADMQTTAMRLSENREYRSNSWVKEGYIAATSIAFTLQDKQSYRDLWIGLSRLTDVTVDNVTWDVSDRIALQNRARVDALAVAKTKAQQMATCFGSRIAEPLAIEEILLEDPWADRGNAMNSIVVTRGAGATADEPISPGEINVRIRVSVSFRLISP
jgi:uncharacterized protein YggE